MQKSSKFDTTSTHMLPYWLQLLIFCPIHFFHLSITSLSFFFTESFQNKLYVSWHFIPECLQPKNIIQCSQPFGYLTKWIIILKYILISTTTKMSVIIFWIYLINSLVEGLVFNEESHLEFDVKSFNLLTVHNKAPLHLLFKINCTGFMKGSNWLFPQNVAQFVSLLTQLLMTNQGACIPWNAAIKNHAFNLVWFLKQP